MKTTRCIPVAALALGLALGGLFVKPATATDSPAAAAPTSNTYKVAVSGMT